MSSQHPLFPLPRLALCCLLLILVACSSTGTAPDGSDPDPDPGEQPRTTVDPADYHEVPPEGTETRQVTFTLPGTTETMTEEVYVIDGYYVYGGDMIVGRDGAQNALAGQAAAMPGALQYWSDGVVPYKIDASLLPEEDVEPQQENVDLKPTTTLEKIDAAVKHWNEKTNITLRKATDADKSWVLFKEASKEACFADIGYGFGERTINLHNSCPTATVIHEIGHVVGLYHEHMRSDRDEYVTVNFDNIDPKQKGNFAKLTSDHVSHLGTYDYGSIMHYPYWGMSKSCPDPSNATTCLATIEPKNPNPTDKTIEKTTMGQREGLSESDIAGVNALYPKKAEQPNEPVGVKFKEQPVQLPASDLGTFGAFGTSVAIDGGYAIVGATEELRTDAPNSPGAAYVFRYTGAGWEEDGKLIPSDGKADDKFGISVAISGNRAIVGSLLFGAEGQQRGAAYIFERSKDELDEDGRITKKGIWDKGQVLTTNVARAEGDGFGTAVAILGDYAVVGAPGQDDNGVDGGAVYFFKRTSEGWIEEYMYAGGEFDATGWRIGASVGLSAAGYAVVGLPGLDLPEMEDAGAMGFFKLAPEGWMVLDDATIGGDVAGARFGSSVAISGRFGVVGASGAGKAKGFIIGNDDKVAAFFLSTDDGDALGGPVAISGNYAAAGTSTESASGSVYVYDFLNSASQTEFTHLQKLTLPSDAQWPKASIAMVSNAIVVGTPISGSSRQGAAYVYQR